MFWPIRSPIAMEQLVKEHSQLLYRLAYRLSGSKSDAEDLTQETFCQAYDKMHQLRQADKAKSWLCTILRNCFLQRKRHSDREVNLPVEEQNELPDRAPFEVPEFDSVQLQQALSEMPEAYRTPILLYFFEEFSYKEIAEQMSLPMGTVMSRLARAKGFLRQRLAGLVPDARKEGA